MKQQKKKDGTVVPSGKKVRDTHKGFFMVPENAIKHLHDMGIKNYGEMMLLFKIYTLSLDSGCCYASNAGLAYMLDCSEDTVKRYLRHLRKLNLVKKYEESEFDEEKGHPMSTKRLLYPQEIVYDWCGRELNY